MPHDVFISHVEEDAQLAVEIARFLEAERISTWYYERDSLPALPYLVQVGTAIDASSAVLLLISTNALSSNQVTAEVVRAYEGSKPFVPLLVDISHVEFQARQPLWRQALAGSTTIRLSSNGLAEVLPRVIAGVRELLKMTSAPPALTANNTGSISATEKQTTAPKRLIDLQQVKVGSPFFVSDSLILGTHNVFGWESLLLFDTQRRRYDIAPYLGFLNVSCPSVSHQERLLFVGNVIGGDSFDGMAIYTANLDGTHPSLVVRTEEQLDDPCFSPDGTRILYDMLNSRRDGVYVVVPRSRGPRRIVPDGYAQAWSPDGNHIAFCLREWEGQKGEFIFVAPADGGNSRFVCEGYGPKWDPNGERLCFTDRSEQRNGTVRIGIAGIDGRNTRLLTPDNAEAFFPKWSPQEDLLYFSMDGDICAYDAASDSINVIAVSRGPWLWPQHISPDGGWIAYEEEYGQRPFRSHIIATATGESIEIGGVPVDKESLSRIAGRADEILTTSGVEILPSVRDYLVAVKQEAIVAAGDQRK